ncbi:ATP-binding cassette domain-containing protein [Leucobacter coleopterorum]|uniref:ATP-binding cassette domain-containing protein n=1 Tax=Leucobacter coleopterorum TaxID=2714933 RepID=UPI003CC7351E
MGEAHRGFHSIRRHRKNSLGISKPHGVPGRSARDHVALPLLAHGNSYREASEEASRLLDRFGLLHAENRPFRALSGGEAQRLMLARGFASKPSLFLVDEPTAQLDLSTSSEVNSSLSKLADDNVTVVVATHDEQTRNACTDLIDLRLFQDPGSGGINQ